MKHTLELHREYVSLQDKAISDMTTHELRVVVTETPSFLELEVAQKELKARGKLDHTFKEEFAQMTGGNIIIES